jgi:hypothetical protein
LKFDGELAFRNKNGPAVFNNKRIAVSQSGPDRFDLGAGFARAYDQGYAQRTQPIESGPSRLKGIGPVVEERPVKVSKDKYPLLHLFHGRLLITIV